MKRQRGNSVTLSIRVGLLWGNHGALGRGKEVFLSEVMFALIVDIKRILKDLYKF